MGDKDMKFKWLEALDSEMLLQAIADMTMDEKMDLILETLNNSELSSKTLKNIIVVYSLVTIEMLEIISYLTDENKSLKLSAGAL